MINARTCTIAASGLLLLATSLYGSDLSQYRQFQLTAELPELARQAEMKVAQAKTIHQRPATIQELTWRAGPGDSVQEVVFRFYNGELFRMVVGYDRYQTDGLTVHDMIEGISATYGVAVDPSDEITLSSIYDDSEAVNVLARWEDSAWSFNLVRSKYQSLFFLIALSKRLEPPALEAVSEALRLDRVEAPQRELARRNGEEEERRLQQEEARLANGPNFRP